VADPEILKKRGGRMTMYQRSRHLSEIHIKNCTPFGIAICHGVLMCSLNTGITGTASYLKKIKFLYTLNC